MFTKKQWKCQQLAEQLRTTSVAIATEAARQHSLYQSTLTSEHAIIADETRKLYWLVIGALEKNIFDKLHEKDFDNIILDASEQTQCLALNTAIVSSKMRALKPLAVYAEEIRNITMQLAELCGVEMNFNSPDIPVVNPRSKAVNETVALFHGVSGRYAWSENTQYVIEVMRYSPEYIKNNQYQVINEWRQMDKPLPVIRLDTAKEAAPDNSCLVIVRNYINSTRAYAVVADKPNVNAISNSYVGVSMTSQWDIPVRECWETSSGKGIHFIDWEELVK